MWTSEDTGFFIPALDYFPGVHANRWMEGTWKDKRDAILKMMEYKDDRRAYLLNKFALVNPSGNLFYIGEVNWYTIGYEDHINPDHPTIRIQSNAYPSRILCWRINLRRETSWKNRGRLAPRNMNVLEENVSERKNRNACRRNY